MTVTQLGAALALWVVDGIGGPQPLFTGPVINPGANVVTCVAQNIGTVPVTMSAVLRDESGVLLDSGMAEVGPGLAVELAAATGPNAGYCRFDSDTDPESARGFLRLRRPTGETLAIFPATTIRLGAGPASEAYSPPLRSINEDVEFGCFVQNLSDEEVSVDAEILDENGGVVDSDTDDVPPGTVLLVVASNAAHLGAYCHFTLTSHAGSVRGFAMLFGPSTDIAHLVFPAGDVGGAGTSAYTPAVSSVAGDVTTCVVQNLDAVALMVTAELVGTTGTVLDDGTMVVAPGDVRTIAGHTEEQDSAVCRFSYPGAADYMRGYITRYPSGLFRNTDLLAEATSPAGPGGMGTVTYAPPVSIGADDHLQCDVINQTSSALSVHYAIADGAGGNIAMVDTVVPAERAKTALAVDQVTDAVCSFTFDEGPDRIRGYASLVDDSAQRTLQVYEARPPGPSPTPTVTMRPTFTVTPSRTATVSPTASRTATATRTLTATATFTVTSTFSATPTSTVTASASVTPTRTPTTTASATVPPSATATATDAIAATATATDVVAATATATNVVAATATATEVLAATATATIARTPIATASPTPATPTAEPTTPPGPCIGDCNQDGRVAINELVGLVGLGLGDTLYECPAGDRNNDGEFTIDELVEAVGNALNGCPGV